MTATMKNNRVKIELTLLLYNLIFQKDKQSNYHGSMKRENSPKVTQWICSRERHFF